VYFETFAFCLTGVVDFRWHRELHAVDSKGSKDIKQSPRKAALLAEGGEKRPRYAIHLRSVDRVFNSGPEKLEPKRRRRELT
jgi:hypothetical protein